MHHRYLTYSDAKSDKFWSITLNGCTHTVHYGRVGTAGQQQTKEFATEEAARQSYEKLVREKVKKGYQETQGQGGEAIAKPEPQAAPSPASEVPPAMAKPAVEVAEPSPAEPESSVNDLPYPPRRSLRLNPEDWFWATWRNLTPLQRPEPIPFDRKDALARLAKVSSTKYSYDWDWSKAKISMALSREEAHFWLAAMTQVSQQVPPKQLVETFATQDFTAEPSFAALCERLFQPVHGSQSHVPVIQQVSIELYRPLVCLFSPTQLVDLLFWIDEQILARHGGSPWNFQRLRSLLVRGFQQYVIPYLSDTQRRELRATIERQLDVSQWPLDYYATPAPVFFLAAYVGCSALQPLVESWEDDRYCQSGWRHDFYHRPQEIILGLGNPESVQLHMRRLKLTLQRPDTTTEPFYLRGWLAHTEYGALDVVRDSALSLNNKAEAEVFNREVAHLVQASEAAPLMLELLASKAPQVCRQWLEENPAQAIAGLLPLTTERSKLGDAAVDALRRFKRKGYTPYIQTCLTHASPDLAARVQATVLEVEETVATPLDQHTTPAWLQAALAVPIKKASKAVWTIAPEALPPLMLGDRCLQDSQVAALLDALAQSKLDSPHPLVVAIKAQLDRPVLEAFAWKLCESWLQDGAPAKANWALMAVGLLGADTCALKLAPLIRVWPGESQHQRAVLGLECLRTMGTDTALMQINGIAQKVKFKGIKQRAQECMEAIAQERQMSRDQLEDRIVPTCDLDERGSYGFDFGSRQFHFVLGADLKPKVRDADGTIKPDLPKPGAKDDRAMAEAAIAQWKLLKKQISEVLKIQPLRLEQAMVTGRRWPVDEFTTLLVQHPLMTHLVQRLIWGYYEAGQLLKTFRVTEDQTCADIHDDSLELPSGMQVGLVHPLHLTDDVLTTWGELLSDYEIIQPFVQLGRSLYTLQPEERDTLEITRFQHLQIPVVTLVRTLENQGWQRGSLHDHGDYSLHFKYFPAANVTAVVGEYEEVFVDLSFTVGSGKESIDRCCFLRGLHNNLYDYPGQSWMREVNDQRIPLGQVDPVIISEVLKDLSAIASKAE